MAARLTVIVSQSARREGRLVDLEETLVTELMLTAGMDATLVGPLESIQADSTDFLCLTGFQHSLAIVSWLEETQVRQHWERLGLAGTVRRVGARGDAGVSAGRAIFYFPLSMSGGTAAVLNGLRELQRDRGTKTVGLALPAADVASANLGASLPAAELASESPSLRPVTSLTPPRQPAPAEPADTPPFGKQVLATPPASSRPFRVTEVSQGPDDDEEWSDLDQLVDDLDALDL